MKKIGIIALVDQNNGGVYQYSQRLIRTLRQDCENQYTVFIQKGSQVALGSNMNAVIIPDKYLSRIRQYIMLVINFMGLKSLTYYLLSKYERELFREFDLLIGCVSNPYPIAYLKNSFIFTFHDLQEYYYPQFFSILVRIKRHMVGSIMTKSATQIICESEYVKEDIANFFNTPKAKIHSIPAMPNIETLTTSPNVSKVINEYRLPENYIFYPSANFWEHKNHINLIKAFNILVKNKCQQVELVLSGDNNSKRYKKNITEIINLTESLNLKSIVHMIGYIKSEHIASVYKLSSVVAIPTLFESISIPMYESFFVGVPVCCSNVVSLPEQAGDAALLFNPNNPEDIADKLMTCLENREIRDDLIRKGKRKIDNMTSDKFVKKLKDVINKVPIA